MALLFLVGPGGPESKTVSGATVSVKVAVTERAWSIVTWQVLVPEQSPDQPAKFELASGAAVSVTVVPISNAAEHVGPQSMPAGLEATVPAPSPSLITESW